MGPRGHVHGFHRGRQTETRRGGGHESGVHRGFGAQSMIQMGHVEVQATRCLDPVQEIQQDHGVEAAGGGDDDAVAVGDLCFSQGPDQDDSETVRRPLAGMSDPGWAAATPFPGAFPRLGHSETVIPSGSVHSLTRSSISTARTR